MKILWMFYLGVNYCFNVTFVGDSKGYLRNYMEEKLFKKKKKNEKSDEC